MARDDIGIIKSKVKALNMKPTRADKLRSMNDEALAAELLSLFAAFYDVEWSIENILDFLKQEAE